MSRGAIARRIPSQTPGTPGRNPLADVHDQRDLVDLDLPALPEVDQDGDHLDGQVVDAIIAEVSRKRLTHGFARSGEAR